ncbi:phage antirepressor KilAC domain-containing protein [Actinobacillus pleuropneumoniae]|uniref:phage antirepressor KilAC domain-containing protein n=1 Tax=Actinobacillus pleuropneumoniae TaxID=715 RepID=UPI003D019FDF
MNLLLNISEQNSSTLTMSSREIARLCEKQHGHVCRDIENLNHTYAEMGLSKIGEGYFTHPSTGNQQHREFLLTREQCIDLITGYRADVRIRINRRWAELESKQSIPKTFSQALRLAAEQQEVIEQQNHQLAIQAPKVAFVEHYVEVGTTKSLRETAKILNFPEKRLIECLERDRVLYRQSGNLLPYQDKQAKQLFTVKTGTAEHGHNFTQTRVTAKGIEWIAQRYASELGQ